MFQIINLSFTVQKQATFDAETARFLPANRPVFMAVNIPACTFMPLTRFSYAEFTFTLKPNRY